MQQCLNEIIGNEPCHGECLLVGSGRKVQHHGQRPRTLPSSYLPQIIDWNTEPVKRDFSCLFLTCGLLGSWGGWWGGAANFNFEMVPLSNQAETVTVAFDLVCSDLMQAKSFRLTSLQAGTDSSIFSKHLTYY